MSTFHPRRRAHRILEALRDGARPLVELRQAMRDDGHPREARKLIFAIDALRTCHFIVSRADGYHITTAGEGALADLADGLSVRVGDAM